LTQDERDLGCCLLDIGGGTTELLVFGGGVVRHNQRRGHWRRITSPMISPSVCARPFPKRKELSAATAARLHLHEGKRFHRNWAASATARHARIFAHMLTDIIEPRAMELLSLLRDDLKRAGWTARFPPDLSWPWRRAPQRLEELAEQSFHLPVRVAEPKGLADLPEQVAQPEYATVVGLVLCGAKARRSRPSVRESGIKIESHVRRRLVTLPGSRWRN